MVSVYKIYNSTLKNLIETKSIWCISVYTYKNLRLVDIIYQTCHKVFPTSLLESLHNNIVTTLFRQPCTILLYHDGSRLIITTFKKSDNAIKLKVNCHNQANTEQAVQTQLVEVCELFCRQIFKNFAYIVNG